MRMMLKGFEIGCAAGFGVIGFMVTTALISSFLKGLAKKEKDAKESKDKIVKFTKEEDE